LGLHVDCEGRNEKDSEDSGEPMHGAEGVVKGKREMRDDG
jgi:hypothetical protein